MLAARQLERCSDLKNTGDRSLIDTRSRRCCEPPAADFFRFLASRRKKLLTRHRHPAPTIYRFGTLRPRAHTGVPEARCSAICFFEAHAHSGHRQTPLARAIGQFSRVNVPTYGKLLFDPKNHPFARNPYDASSSKAVSAPHTGTLDRVAVSPRDRQNRFS